MAEVKNISNWKSIVEFSEDGPRHQVLLDTETYRVVLVGLEAGVKIPPHPSTDASYHFLEGSGWMVVDGTRHPVSAGTTMVVPANAERGIEAETRLAFLGSHGGHGTQAGHQHEREVPNRRRPMLMFGLMTLAMIVVMVGLWQIGASPLAMMLTGFDGMGLGAWGAMLLPMLGLLGMFVMMFVMYRTMASMGGGMMKHDHAAMMAKKDSAQKSVPSKMQVTFTVPAISCTGCKKTIEESVAKLEGVASVRVDIGTRQAVIGYDAPATEEAIENLLAEIGYPVAQA